MGKDHNTIICHKCHREGLSKVHVGGLRSAEP